MNDRPQKPRTRRGKCHYRAAFDEGVSVCRLMLRLCKDVEDGREGRELSAKAKEAKAHA